MKLKEIFICFLSVLFLAGFSYYSMKGYEKTVNSDPLDLFTENPQNFKMNETFAQITTETLNVNVPFKAFTGVLNRNPFEKVEPIVPKKAPVIKVELPTPKKIEVQPVVKEPEVVINYIYRGTVVLGEKIAYVIERDIDKKTFFVNKGDRTKDFIVLDTTDSKVVITDYQENVRVLRKQRK